MTNNALVHGDGGALQLRPQQKPTATEKRRGVPECGSGSGAGLKVERRDILRRPWA